MCMCVPKFERKLSQMLFLVFNIYMAANNPMDAWKATGKQVEFTCIGKYLVTETRKGS